MILVHFAVLNYFIPDYFHFLERKACDQEKQLIPGSLNQQPLATLNVLSVSVELTTQDISFCRLHAFGSMDWT